jgi:hypothetical protein
MMTLRRFRALTQSYGAELQRWPQEERDAARELLESSGEAQALLAQERSLDAAISAASSRGVQPQEAALARLRSGVAARIVAEDIRAQQRGGFFGWLLGGGRELDSLRRRRLGLATSGALAIVAGLLIGAMYGPAPAPAHVGVVAALLQPATLDILSDQD